MMADEKKASGNWTSTPGWSGYAAQEVHEGHEEAVDDKGKKIPGKTAEEKGEWVCNAGWCGYVKPNEKDQAKPAEKPAEKKPDDKGEWTCTPGWCGYVKPEEHKK